MISRKHGKATGWTYPQCTIKEKKEYIINECLDPQPYWDEWNDHRDGFRGYDDRKKIQKHRCARYDNERWKKKNKLLLARRKVRLLR